MKRRISDYQKKISELHIELADVSRQLGEAVSARDSALGEEKKIRETIRVLEEKVTFLTGELARLDAQHGRHQARISDVVYEHSRLLVEHADRVKGLKEQSAVEEQNLSKLKDSQSAYENLLQKKEKIASDIVELESQAADIIEYNDDTTADIEKKKLALETIDNDIQQKIKENGRILTDITTVRHELEVHVQILQRYYDEAGLKMGAREILNVLLEKNHVI